MTKNPKPAKTDKFIIFNEYTKRYLTLGCDLDDVHSGVYFTESHIENARKFNNYEFAMRFMQALNTRAHYEGMKDNVNPWGVINYTWQKEIGVLPAPPKEPQPVVDIKVTTRTEPYKPKYFRPETPEETKARWKRGEERKPIKVATVNCPETGLPLAGCGCPVCTDICKPEEPQPDYSAVQPSHYAQGAGGANFDVIEALYQVLPWEQFKGYMKGNIIKYTVRYDAKNGTEDVEKSAEYTRRLQGYEVRHEAIKKLESEGR